MVAERRPGGRVLCGAFPAASDVRGLNGIIFARLENFFSPI